MKLYWLQFLLFPILVLTTPAQQDASDELPKSIIDVLSSNIEFSIFLRLIQRKGLIPYLNELENVTLVAPVNSAFVDDSLKLINSENLKSYIIQKPILSTDFSGIKLLDTYYETSSHLYYPILVTSDEDNLIFDDSQVVEADLIASNQYSIVQGVDTLLHLHGSLCQTLSPHNSNLSDVDFFKSLIDENDCHYNNYTLLLPLDDSLSFNEIEKKYLLSKQGLLDKKSFLNNYFIKGYHGGYLNENVTNLNNDIISINSTNNGNEYIINGTYHSKYNNILTSNGLIHIFDSSLNFDSTITFNARKYLIGLELQNFVKSIDFNDLGYLIDDLSINQTILIDKDFDEFNYNNNLYHFINEKIDFYDSSFTSKLVESKLYLKKMKHYQKIKISKIDSNKIFINNNILIISNKIEIGNTVIYIIDEELSLPNNLKHAVGPMYHCSRSISYLDDLNLISLPSNENGYSIFLPCYNSWKDLGLTFNYLERNETALKLILDNLIINDLVYSDFDDILNTTTLDHTNITLSKENENFKLNNSLVPIVYNSDILFNQGVVHPIKDMIYPDSLEISLSSIIKATDSHSFLALLDSVNLLDLVDDLNHSIILPSPSSLRFANITKFTTNIETFLKLHIIPNEFLHNLLTCDDEIETIAGIKLSCHELSSNIYMLKLLNNDNHEVRILDKGCTTFKDGSQSCVLMIDRPILPNWLDYKDRLHIHLPIVSMAIGIIIGIVLISGAMLVLLVMVGKPTSIDETSVLDDENSLLNDDDDSHPNSYGSTSSSNHEWDTSEPIIVNPDQSFKKNLDRERNLPGSHS